jgi:acetylornithine deacetylase/succinyl-diaminopimelate desuccinylase-like protein
VENSISQYLASQEQAHLDAFDEFLRIPSISALPEYGAEIERAADWVATALRLAGVPDVAVVPTPGWPVVVGRWQVAADRPTVLIYGHYDVQPADPLDLWTTPPFEPAIRDGKIYARGAADMKGNYLAVIQAIAAFTATAGRPPLNVTFMCEGEEEIGSPSLPAFLRAERERLACDFVLSADGGMAGPETPSLTVALRGLASCQIDLRTSTTDLHSGQFGAIVPNAARELASLLATFHDDQGRVAVAGFYDDVRELTDDDRAEIAAVPIDETMLLRQSGANALTGEAGYTLLERRWARPTLDINGSWSGFQGEGSKTVTPCQAHAKITCRLVPDQEPVRILDLIEHHVARHVSPGVEATLTRFAGSARPFSLRRDHPALQAAKQTLLAFYGREPLIVRSGGTVPATSLIQRELGADTVTLAFMLPDCRAHAPDEWFRLHDFRLASRVYAAFLAAVGEISPTG